MPKDQAQSQAPAKRASKTSRSNTTAKSRNAKDLPWAKHVVCFWKQNDLGLYGRRPDRWIEYWRQHPDVEKVFVFEPPLAPAQLQEMLRLATTLDKVSASEYQLLLQQATKKLIGHCDDNKVQYCTYLSELGKPAVGREYLNWVLGQTRQAGISDPLIMLWPACFANEALIKQMEPSEIWVDLVDDQRLFPGNEGQQKAITDQYKTFIAAADQVVSNSTGLIESFSREFGRPVKHLPNALLPMLPVSAPINPKGRSRPVVGYVGNLRGRIDVATLTDVIQKHTEWDFWFVGQTHRSAFYEAVKALPNARFWGALPYDKAHAVMENFDVAIVPFVDDALVNSMSPIKLDDYSRSKRPTVVLDPAKKADFAVALSKALKPRK